MCGGCVGREGGASWLAGEQHCQRPGGKAMPCVGARGKLHVRLWCSGNCLVNMLQVHRRARRRCCIPVLRYIQCCGRHARPCGMPPRLVTRGASTAAASEHTLRALAAPVARAHIRSARRPQLGMVLRAEPCQLGLVPSRAGWPALQAPQIVQVEKARSLITLFSPKVCSQEGLRSSPQQG